MIREFKAPIYIVIKKNFGFNEYVAMIGQF